MGDAKCVRITTAGIISGMLDVWQFASLCVLVLQSPILKIFLYCSSYVVYCDILYYLLLMYST